MKPYRAIGPGNRQSLCLIFAEGRRQKKFHLLTEGLRQRAWKRVRSREWKKQKQTV